MVSSVCVLGGGKPGDRVTFEFSCDPSDQLPSTLKFRQLAGVPTKANRFPRFLQRSTCTPNFPRSPSPSLSVACLQIRPNPTYTSTNACRPPPLS